MAQSILVLISFISVIRVQIILRNLLENRNTEFTDLCLSVLSVSSVF